MTAIVATQKTLLLEKIVQAWKTGGLHLSQLSVILNMLRECFLEYANPDKNVTEDLYFWFLSNDCWPERKE